MFVGSVAAIRIRFGRELMYLSSSCPLLLECLDPQVVDLQFMSPAIKHLSVVSRSKSLSSSGRIGDLYTEDIVIAPREVGRCILVF